MRKQDIIVTTPEKSTIYAIANSPETNSAVEPDDDLLRKQEIEDAIARGDDL